METEVYVQALLTPATDEDDCLDPCPYRYALWERVTWPESRRENTLYLSGLEHSSSSLKAVVWLNYHGSLKMFYLECII
jgi:hypothetical protein